MLVEKEMERFKSQLQNITPASGHMESQHIPVDYSPCRNVTNILYEISMEIDDSAEMTKIEKSQLKFGISIG